jgi:NAD-dependent dihydropyrimidine dehydrogenase PreA subunit
VGTFIQIEIDARKIDPATAQALPPLCPVDIYVVTEGRLIARPEQEDECTLCELCLAAAPAGAVRIRKTYKDEVLVSRRPEANT